MTAPGNYDIERLVADAMRLGRVEQELFISRLPEDVRPEVARRIAGSETRQTQVAPIDPEPQNVAVPPIWCPMRGGHIGPYALIDSIGRGAYGEVWKVEQRAPNRRFAALKILHPGMHSELVLRRFRVEQRALGILDHPGIAKIFDAGVAPSGVPYFVMQYVKGLRLDEYFLRERPSLRARLGIFATLCDAVHHAHERGLVHRDLKPSNILVATPDRSSPYPVVVDFGVVKAIESPLTSDTAYSMQSQPLGTWPYMSPEQVAGDPDVGRTSDIYSLGVILYQLLVGTCPIEPDRFTSVSDEERRRLVREEVPPPPDARLQSYLPSGRARYAADRGLGVQEFQRYLRGDVSEIAMCAIRKEPSRRYQTAQAMAADVRSFLDGRPVSVASGKWRRARRTLARQLPRLAWGSASIASSAAIAWVLWPHPAPGTKPPLNGLRGATPTQAGSPDIHLGKATDTNRPTAPPAAPPAAAPPLRWSRTVDSLGRVFTRSLRLLPPSRTLPFDSAEFAAAGPALALIAGDPDANGGQHVELWRANGQEPLHLSLRAPDGKAHDAGTITSMVFDNESKRLLATTASATLLAWNTQVAGPPTERALGESVSVALGATRSGGIVVLGSDTIRIVDPVNPAIDRTLPVRANDLAGRAVSPGGDWLFSASVDGSAWLTKLDETGATRQLLPSGPDAVDAFGFAADGTLVASASADRIYVWRCGSDAPVWTSPAELAFDRVFSLSIAPGGRHLVSGHFGGELRVWNLDDSSCITIARAHQNSIQSVCWAPTGRNVVTCSMEGGIALWSWDGTALVPAPGFRPVENAGPPLVAQFSGDGSLLVAISDREVQVWPIDLDR